MLKLAPLFLLLLLSSCGDAPVTSAENTESETKENQVEETEKPTLEDRAYPFMELKDLYNAGLSEESIRNKDLDGEIVTISGAIYTRGKRSALQDDGSVKVIGAQIRFREHDHSDEENHTFDFTCDFNEEWAEEVQRLEKGETVTLSGTIIKQDSWIRPEVSFRAIELEDCQLIKQ